MYVCMHVCACPVLLLHIANHLHRGATVPKNANVLFPTRYNHSFVMLHPSYCRITVWVPKIQYLEDMVFIKQLIH